MDLDLSQITSTATSLVELSRELPSNKKPEKAGGYLLLGLENLSTRKILEIGECDPQKLDKYWAIVQEKAHRLYADWLRYSPSILSSQTRQPDMNRWGGAVLFNIPKKSPRSCNIISFSGLAEAADEAVSFALGHHLGFANYDYLERVVAISNNQVLREMAQRLDL